VVRFFFFFSRCLFFDPLTFVAERTGSKEVSPLDMVLLAGWALVPAAAFGLIPDLTGRLTGEGDGLRGVSEELSLASGACFFDFLTVTLGDSSMVTLGNSMVTSGDSSSMVTLDDSSMVTLGNSMVALGDSSSMVTCDSSSMVTLGKNSTCLRLEEVSLVTIPVVVCAGGAWRLAILGSIPDEMKRDP